MTPWKVHKERASVGFKLKGQLLIKDVYKLKFEWKFPRCFHNFVENNSIPVGNVFLNELGSTGDCDRGDAIQGTHSESHAYYEQKDVVERYIRTNISIEVEPR